MFLRILSLISLLICASFLTYLVKTLEANITKDFQYVASELRTSSTFPKSKIEQLVKLEGVSVSIFDTSKKVIYTSEKKSSTIYYLDQNNKAQVLKLNGKFMLNANRSPIYTVDSNLKIYTGNGFALAFNDNAIWNSQNIYIQITSNLTRELFSILLLLPILFVINMFFLIVVIFKGSRASKRMLKPVEQMTTIVKNITINALDTRLDISGSQDELKELAETFNSMLDRIQQSYEQQNQFVSDASHELRTPIAVIQGYANLLSRWGKNDQVVMEESIESIKSESKNMQNLIDKLLFLARGDNDIQKLETENFYLDELLEEVIKETRLINDTHQIICTTNPSIFINADRKLLKEALRVFIDNSIKYTPSGGKVEIGSHTQYSQAVIVIEDTGVGISNEDLPHIFNRFYRADKSRTKQTGGTGLGLAIAKWIITKHQGKINVESEVNAGTKVTLHLPLHVQGDGSRVLKI